MQPPLQYFVLDGMPSSSLSIVLSKPIMFERFTSVVIVAGFSPSDHDPTSLSAFRLIVGRFFYMLIT